jgi:hypothetical protein
MIPTTEFTIGSNQIIDDETKNEEIFNEVKKIITDQKNSYKVFVDGYDLKNNLEISRKLFSILIGIQGWTYSILRCYFPYISYSSFHDKTLEYESSGNLPFIRNCNSIITRLGARYICNWYLYYDRVFVKELPNENLPYSVHLIMYEKDINSVEYGSYERLTIVPSEENKDITIKNYIGNIEFLDKFTTPKNIYKMSQVPYNIPSQYEHLFQKLENE